MRIAELPSRLEAFLDWGPSYIIFLVSVTLIGAAIWWVEVKYPPEPPPAALSQEAADLLKLLDDGEWERAYARYELCFRLLGYPSGYISLDEMDLRPEETFKDFQQCAPLVPDFVGYGYGK